MIEDKQEEELLQWMNQTSTGGIIFCYTPLCGTCKLATKMLQVIQPSFSQIPFFSCNVNGASKLVETYQVSSVPCLLFIQPTGRLKEKIYAFHSIPFLYEKLLQWTE